MLRFPLSLPHVSQPSQSITHFRSSEAIQHSQMDTKIAEDESQNVVSDFKSEKILTGGEKPTAFSPAPMKKLGEIFENKNLEPKIACQTPEKKNEVLHHKTHEGEIKLPDKYRSLSELFDHLNFSLRLLGLFKRVATFQNISTQVEVLSKRNFSYKHLGRMKYILPEAFQIEKILIHDKKTLLMMPDMKITLLFDVVEGHSEVSNFVALCRVFMSRLYDFFTKNPQASDVPEASLPEFFKNRSQIPIPEKLPMNSFIESQPASVRIETSAENVLPYFSKNFSQCAAVAETGLSSISTCISVEDKLTGVNEPAVTGSESTHRNPEVESYTQCSVGSSFYGSPLVKLTSSDDSFRTETPAQSVPSRLVPSYDNKQKMISDQKSTSCSKPAKRVLDFSHMEDDKSALSYSEDEGKCYKSVHEDIPQTDEGIFGDENTIGSSSLIQETAESFSCPNEDYNQTHELNYQDSSGCVADMIGLIHSIFKSVNYTPITKEELVHKLIVNNFDIVDKREAQEHVDHLERVVPDWIKRKMAPSGDIMYSIKEVSDLDTVKARAK